MCCFLDKDGESRQRSTNDVSNRDTIVLHSDSDSDIDYEPTEPKKKMKQKPTTKKYMPLSVNGQRLGQPGNRNMNMKTPQHLYVMKVIIDS